MQDLYRPKGFTSQFLICKELFNTSLAKYKNIENYLNQVKRLADELIANDLAISERVLIAWTLNNLTPEYESAVAIISQAIRTGKGDLSLDDLFAQLLDES